MLNTVKGLNRVEVACFGNCVLDQRKRELRVEGVARPIAPRVFDVLSYLIQNRDRVVRKKELVLMHWTGAVVSGSAVSRTIYKARAAIGDPVENPAYIKTIHRVGYRFVGELTNAGDVSRPVSSAVERPAPAPQQVAGSPLIRMALLPFVNRLEERQFDWIDLGLMSLVRQALQLDSRLALAPTADVLRAIEPIDASLPSAEVAAAVQPALESECLLSCTVSRSGDMFRLDYEAHGPAAKGLAGHVESAELTQLGQQLTGAIEAFVDAEDVRLVPMESKDPFTNQALARALESQALQLHERAALYFRIVLELEPQNHLVQIAAVRSLTQVDPSQAVAVARQLVEDLAEQGDTRLLGAAHGALGNALRATDSCQHEAEFHLTESLRLGIGKGGSAAARPEH